MTLLLRISSVHVTKTEKTADLVTFTEETLMENFIFCAVFILILYWLEAHEFRSPLYRKHYTKLKNDVITET